MPKNKLVRRFLVRRFNELYGNGKEIIEAPKELLSSTPRLAGLDGNSKMGKSLGNGIYLSDDAETVTAKVKSAITDTNRIAVSDKGDPDICTVSIYHKTFNANEYDNICDLCRNAKIGCVACKKQLAAKLNNLLAPIRENAKHT